MKGLMYKVAQGYIRHTLTGVGGAMVAQGIMSNSNETAIIGGIMAIVATLWSHISKIPAQDNGTTSN